jgi:hypothetical protein
MTSKVVPRGRPTLSKTEKSKRALIAGDYHENRIGGMSHAAAVEAVVQKFPGTGKDTVEKAARAFRDLLPGVDISVNITDKQIASYRNGIAVRSKNSRLKSRK